jgi:hypothetical protein
LDSHVKEKHRQKVFEFRALKRIFGRKRDQMTGGWRKLHNEEFYNLYASSHMIEIVKSRNMMGRECSICGGDETYIENLNFKFRRGERTWKA